MEIIINKIRRNVCAQKINKHLQDEVNNHCDGDEKD